MALKTCTLCEERFEPAKKHRTVCPKDHYRACKFCGEDFIVTAATAHKECCSGSCGAKWRASQVTRRACAFCGDEFEAKGSTKFCGKDHLRECVAEGCGKEFKVNPSRPKDFCSRACSLGAREYVKSCQRCGEEFTTSNSMTVYCTGPHYSTCARCGESFEEKVAKRVTTYCSTSCSSKGRVYENVCVLCGDNFTSGKKDSKFCSKDHLKECPKCGDPFVFDPYQPTETCGRKCGWKLANEDNKLVEKRKASLRERYGVDNPSLIPSVKEKKKATAQRNYGVDNPSSSPEVQEKRRQTSLDRYGVEHPLSAPEVRDKIRETNLERYGVENVFQAEAIKEKIGATLQERYGVSNPFLLPQAVERLKEVGNRRISKLNLELKAELEKIEGVTVELEAPFGPAYAADLGVGRVLVDLNPSITHNSTTSFLHLTGRCKEEGCAKETHAAMPPDWHQKRMLAAELGGSILLQKFDWHDDEIFLSVVKSKLKLDEHRVGARKCTLREITQAEANRFFKENHLLGGASKQSFCVGLFYGEELVHCHTYGPARMNSHYQWEAIRSASKMGWQVMGGFSRCDKYFFETMKPESVISYVDLAISQGDTELLFPGWRALNEKPNNPAATWVYFGSAKERGKKPEFIKARSAAFQSADRLLGLPIGEKYPSHHPDGRVFTNDDVLLAEGYLKVFDAGTRTFVWTREQLAEALAS